MTKKYLIKINNRVPTSLSCLFLLKKTIEDVHTKYKSFQKKGEIAQFFLDIMWNHPFLESLFEVKIIHSLSDDHVLFQLLRFMILSVTNVRLGFLDGQKRHYIMSMCLCNKKPQYFNNQCEDLFIDDSTKKHLTQFRIMTTPTSYSFVTDRFFRDGKGYNVLGKKTFPMLKKKSYYVIKAHEKHHGLTFPNWLSGWLSGVKKMGDHIPGEEKESVLLMTASYYSMELHEMRYKLWGKNCKDSYSVYQHMNNLRAIALKSLLEEKKFDWIKNLTGDCKKVENFGDEAMYHSYLMNFCGDRKVPVGLMSLNALSGKHALMSVVLFMTSMFYHPDSFETFQKLVQTDGSSDLKGMNEKTLEGVLKGSLSVKCVSVVFVCFWYC